MSFSILLTSPPNRYPNLCPLFNFPLPGFIVTCPNLPPHWPACGLSLPTCNPSLHCPTLPCLVGYWLASTPLADSHCPQSKPKLPQPTVKPLPSSSDLLFSPHSLPLLLLRSTPQSHSPTHVFSHEIHVWAHVVSPAHSAVSPVLPGMTSLSLRTRLMLTVSHSAFSTFHCVPLLQTLYCN